MQQANDVSPRAHACQSTARRSNGRRPAARTAVLRAAVAGAALWAGRPADAQTTTWTNGATTATWSDAGNWSAGEPTATLDALFPTPIPAGGATVTLATGELAKSLTFRDAYTLTGGNLALTAPAGLVTVAPTFTVTINSALVGSSGLTLAANNGLAGADAQAGGGRLVLGGINTFTGAVNINAGVLEITGTTNTTNTAATDVANRLGAANTVVNLNGGTLRYNSSNAIRFPFDASALNQHVFNILAGGGTFDTPSGQFEISNTANSLTAVAGAVLTKTGAATLRVASANANFSNTASVIVNAGVLEAGTATSFGTTTPVTVNGGSFAGNADVAHVFTLAGGAINPQGGDRTFTGTVAVNANSSVSLKDWHQNTGRNLTLSGALSGSGGLAVTGLGTGQRLVLSGNNSGYTGTVTANAGHNVVYAAANSQPGTGGGTTINTSTTALGGVGYNFDFGATIPTFTNTRTGTTTGGVFGVNTTLAAGTTLNLASLGGGGMFLGSQTTGTYAATTLGADGTNYRLGGGNGTLNVTAAVLADNGGATNLVVGDSRANGGGTVVLGGTASTFTGAVNVNNGTLSVSNVENGGTASPLGAGTGPIGIGSSVGAQLTFTGATDSTNRAITLGTGGGTVNVTTAGTTLTVGGITSTNGPLTKAGPGTLALGGTATNTVTILTMNGGTLDIGANNLAINNLGGNTIKGTVNSTINATGGGALVISTNGTTGTDFGDNSVANGVTLTINAKLTGANTNAGFEYCCDNPGGTIVLTNAGNDFNGPVVMNSAGTISVAAIGPAGATGPLGKGSLISLVGTSGTQGARLLYTGPGETTDRVVNLGQTANILDASGTGLLRFTANLTATGANAKTLTLQGTGSGELAGVIPNNTAAAANTTSIAKTGSGTWTLSGANTFTGGVTINVGALRITNGSALGTGTKTVTITPTANPGSLPSLQLDGGGGNITLPSSISFTTSYEGSNAGVPIAGAGAVVNVAGDNTIQGSFGLTSGGGGTTFLSNAGTLTVSGNISAIAAAGSARTLVLRGDGGGTLSGVISNGSFPVSVTREVGTGTWVLTGANTYTGATTITAGTLLANNTGATSATGTGNVTVSGTGTFGGDGRITGSLTVNSGGTLSPGTSPGILSTGPLTMASGSTLREELAGTIAGTGGYDQTNVTGAVSLGNATLQLVELFQPAVNDTFTIINNDAADLVTGTFAGLAQNATVSGPFNNFRISYTGGDGNDVVLTALTSNPVPEPAAASLLGAAALGLLARRRRARVG